MRRAAVLAAVAVLAATGAFFVSASIARADDCSTPEDCANTAWTVGGAAAAAAAVAGAAAAAGWLPGREADGLPEGRDGNRLSPECFIDLQLLSTPIKATIQQIAELTVSMTGAGRMWIDAQRRAAAAQYQAAVLAGSSQAAAAATVEANLSSAIGVGAGYHTARRVATMERYSRGLARAAEQFRGMGDVTEAARATRWAASHADEAQRLASPLGRAGGRIATGAGIVNIAAEIYGQYTYGSTEEKLRHAGQLLTEAETARIEAMRWKKFMDHTEARIEQLKPRLLAQVRAYNTRAEECNAVPLSEDLDAFSAVTQQAAGEQMPAAGSQVAPGSILRRAPEPLPERDPMYTNCNAAFYQQQLQLYRNDLRDWQRRSDLWVRWRKRQVDLEVTANAARLEVTQLEYELQVALGNFRALGWLSGTTAAAALIPLFSPIGQVIFGGVSLISGMAETYLSPSAWQAVIVGRIKGQMDWLKNQLGYASQEEARLRTFLNSLEANLRARRGDLRGTFKACKGAELGWEPVPDLPDFYSPYQLQPGNIRSVKDFARWP